MLPYLCSAPARYQTAPCRVEQPVVTKSVQGWDAWPPSSESGRACQCQGRPGAPLILNDFALVVQWCLIPGKLSAGTVSAKV